MSEEAAPTPDQVRSAAEAVKAAIDAHLAAVERRSGENDPHVQKAYDELAAAAEDYDDILYSAYEEVTPFGPIEGLVEDEDDEVEWLDTFEELKAKSAFEDEEDRRERWIPEVPEDQE